MRSSLRLLARAVPLLLLGLAPVQRAQAASPAAPPPAERAMALGITLSPDGGTFYSAAITVRIGWCDTWNGTRKVKWNGTTIPGTYMGTLSSDPSCDGIYRYSDVSLTMVPGANTLWTEACDVNTICVNETATYTYLTSDTQPPTATISPSSLTTSSASVPVTITWCDGNALGTGRRIKFNGVDVTASFTYATSAGGVGTSCAATATSAGSVAPRAGLNTLTAEIQDAAGNWGPAPAASAGYTYRPTIDTSPTNQFSTGPGMFDATLSYTTPAYHSLDQDRSVTLVYASSQARPNALLQVDVTDVSAQPADTMSLGVLWHGVYQIRPDGVQTDIQYRTQSGTNRLTSFYGANGSPTRSMDMQAVVKRFWTGASATDTVPLRVLVINEKDSPYGAGWTVAGLERVVNSVANGGDPGIIMVHGDGTGTFYPMYTSCNASKVCSYGHTPGDFGTMAYDSVNAKYVHTARDGIVSTFSAAGLLTEVRDRLNNVQSYTYVNGKVSTITDPAGKVTTFGYDAAGKLSTITDPAGRVSGFVVNAANDLVSITDPEGVVALQVTYNTSHRVTSYVDRALRTWTFTWDAFGKVATTTTPSFTAEGGQSFQLTTSYTSLEMAAQGQVNGGTHAAPLPRVNPATLRVSITDPRSRITRYALDPWGAASRVEDYTGYAATSTRNVEGQLVSATDARGNTTGYGWNGGDLTSVTNAGGSTAMVYDAAGNVTDVTLPTGETVKNVYSATTGLLTYSLADGDTTSYTYDTRGRVLTVTDPGHHVTTYDYTDPTPQLWKNTRSVTAGGRATTFRYDAYGRLAGATNAQGRETAYQYDVLNRQRYVTMPDNGTTEYVWGRIFLDRVNDARGQAYTWTRNAMGWVTSESRPGDTTGVHRATGYDRYGRATSSTNRRGQAVSVTYDAQDRVVSRTADGQTTTFAFSPDQPTNPSAPGWFAVSNAESTDTVSVDGRGRLTSVVSQRVIGGGFGVTQRFELQPRYDAFDRPVGLVVLQPESVRDSIGYAYNVYTGRMTGMRDIAGGTSLFQYDLDGALTQTTLPTSQILTYGYTSTHLPRSLRYGALGVDNVAGVEYEYDALNRVQSWMRPNYTRDREFAYDINGGWLSGWSDYTSSGSSHPTCTTDANNGTVCGDPAGTMTLSASDGYSYDLTGNPTNHGATTGAGNRLATYDGYALAYDLDGNLVSKTKAGFTQTFTWNSLNQLTEVTTNGSTVSYGYDGMGKRVRRRVDLWDTGYLYDGANLLLEYDASGVQAKYTYHPGSLAPHSVRRGAQTYYFATDALGSVLAMFNSSNTVVNQYGYLPFGEAQSTSETVPNPLRFAGRELEAGSGLYYNDARWYDPSLHRFITEDPIGLDGGINLYTYVGNDPVNATDPSGTFGCRKLPVGFGYLQDRGKGPYTGPYMFEWECDFWGAPPDFLNQHPCPQLSPWWTCSDQDPDRLLVDDCYRSRFGGAMGRDCAATLREASGAELQQLRQEMRRPISGGFCSAARDLALEMANAVPKRVGIYGVYPGAPAGMGATLRVGGDADPSRWVTLIYLKEGRWSAPTVLHEAGHKLALPGHPFGLTHDTPVDVPGQGQMRMCEAAFACVGQRSTAGCRSGG